MLTTTASLHCFLVADSARDQLQASLGSSYTLERELGGGGMARVFVAEEHRLGRKVVVKALSGELASAVSADRFEREMRVAATLQDPRIVPVLAAGEANGVPYYTMPFVEGESLHARLQRGQPSITECIAILRDVALALQHAHASGVVHRDIKPANILLSRGTALVTDFGVAKAIDVARVRTGDGSKFAALTATQLGLAVGTPAYMAPEQALGEAEVDQRADVYAWGVVAYELLAGAHPFGGRTSAQAMIGAHVSEAPPPLAARAPSAPRALIDLVEQALRKDPADRPRDAGAILRGLEGLHVVSRRSRVPALRWAVAALGIAGLVGMSAWLVRGDGSSEPAPAPRVRTVAVLPFATPGDDSTTRYLGVGMTEALATTLARLPDLRVISNRSLGDTVDGRAAGRTLGVDAILDGSVQRSTGQLRIRARLTRVADGVVLWGEHYDRSAVNMFALEDEVTAAIVTALHGTLSRERASLAVGAPRGTSDTAAYDLFLRGRYAWSRRGERSLRAAVDLFDRALARDPRFARAHAGRAMALVVLPLFASGMRGDSVLDVARASAEHALALDSTLAAAHLAMAYANKMQWRWSEAERHFRAAASLAPEDPAIHHWFGVYLYAMGDAARSVAELARARDLDPFNATIGTDGATALYAARRFVEGRAEIRRAMTLDSTKSDTWLVQGLIQLASGEPDSAALSLEMARSLGIGFDMRPYLATADRERGQSARARAAYDQVRRDRDANRALDWDVAVAALAVNDREAALAAIQRVISKRDIVATELSLPCDPLFDSLKSDPRFARMLEGAGMRLCPGGGAR
jgi:eukaryotic-like serine/threonine-protein kinase